MPWQASVCENTPQFTLFLIVLALIMAKNYARNRAIRLFCKFEIIQDDMANMEQSRNSSNPTADVL